MSTATTVFGLWYGGSSYSTPMITEDLESFDSIRDALDIFEARYNNRDGRFPCVGSDCRLELFLSEPDSDPIPDRIVKIGPRGGIVIERV